MAETREDVIKRRGDHALLVLMHMLYGYCPRGAGDFEEHEKKYLTHRVWRGRCICMTKELAKDFDADG